MEGLGDADVRLPLATARAAVAAFHARAASLEARLSVAIVDEGGNLVVFERMDGASLSSVETAINKAYTAAATRMSTRELAALVAPGQPLFGLGDSAASPRPLVPMLGGVPIVLGERVVGGVGVAGGHPDTDDDVARAATEALKDPMSATSPGDVQ